MCEQCLVSPSVYRQREDHDEPGQVWPQTVWEPFVVTVVPEMSDRGYHVRDEEIVWWRRQDESQ